MGVISESVQRDTVACASIWSQGPRWALTIASLPTASHLQWAKKYNSSSCVSYSSSLKDCCCIQVFTTDCSSLFLLSSYVTLFLSHLLFQCEPMCDELIVLVPFSFYTVPPNVHAERRSLTVGVHQIIVLECSVEASPPTAHHLWHKGSMYSIDI